MKIKWPFLGTISLFRRADSIPELRRLSYGLKWLIVGYAFVGGFVWIGVFTLLELSTEVQVLMVPIAWVVTSLHLVLSVRAYLVLRLSKLDKSS